MKTPEENYLKLHEQAESIIKREADKCAIDHSIRTKWDDQHIEVQYMIIGSMIEFAKLYANQKLDEAAVKATFNVSTNGLPLSHFYVRKYIIGDKIIKIDKQSILSLKDKV